MAQIRAERMARSARLFRRLDGLYLRRQELEAQIKVINHEYQRALHEEQTATKESGCADGG